MSNYKEGQVVSFKYPFTRVMASTYNGKTNTIKCFPSWRPGLWQRDDRPYGDISYWADEMGEQVLTIVSTHKPGGFPERIFFTRKWKSPNGKMFGKNRCCVLAISAFKGLLHGYRHEFEISQGDDKDHWKKGYEDIDGTFNGVENMVVDIDIPW